MLSLLLLIIHVDNLELFKGSSLIRFFARLISNSFCENSNLPSIHASLFVQLFYVVFVK